MGYSSFFISRCLGFLGVYVCVGFVVWLQYSWQRKYKYIQKDNSSDIDVPLQQVCFVEYGEWVAKQSKGKEA